MIRRSLLLCFVLALAASGIARAQGPVYLPTPPTPGALYGDGQSGRYLLGGTWLYRADLANVGLAQGWWGNVADTDGWSPVSVPNAFNAGDLSSASMNGWVGWYRRDFTLPAGAFPKYVTAADRHWIIRFESVNYRATVWLNGKEIGAHVGAYLPFELDLSGLRPGVNRLIVRVDNRHTLADLPPSGALFWNYGGLLREVYVRAVQRADLSQVQVTPMLPCPTCSATIDEQVVVRNLSAAWQTVRLRGRYGNVPIDFGSARIAPHASWTAAAEVGIDHPRLWAPGQPALYRATLTLSDQRGRTLGGYSTESGIRSITVTPGGRLAINGRLVNLRGVNLHEQDLTLGGALDPAHLTRLISWVRALGATVIRAHYPLDPEIEELADRYGILLWSEVPVYQTNDQYFSAPGWLAQAQAVLKANILTNQNHPSVLLWSIANELPNRPSAAQAHYISIQVALAHKLDPTRPVGMAVNNWPGLGCQRAYAPLDVIGLNEYFGWFDSNGGATDDRDQLSPYLDTFRACYPTKAVFVTEFGFDANRDGPVEERGTYEFQSNAIAFHLGVFATKPWLSAAIYFALQDFAARPGWGGGDPLPDPPFVQKGLVDLQGNVKPSFSVVSAIYHATVQIAPAAGAASRSGGHGPRRRR